MTYSQSLDRSSSPLDKLALGFHAPVKPKKKEPPGPGAYTSNYGTIGYNASFKGKVMLGRHFAPTKAEASPGPAAYSPRLMPKAPAYSLQGRFVQLGLAAEEAYPSPGPGEYNVATDIGNRNAPTLKSRTAVVGDALLSPRRPADARPGPGAYDASFSGVQATPRTAHLSPRRPETIKPSPGPGHYDTRTKKAEGPQFTLTGRGNSNPLGALIDVAVPGPGAYHIPSLSFQTAEQISLSSAPGKSFGERLPEPSRADDVPGPGAYDTPRIHEAKSFSLIQKPKPEKEGNDNPGPGEYDTSDGIGKGPRGITFKARPKPPPMPEVPGPGAYDRNPAALKSPRSISIRKPINPQSYQGYVPTKSERRVLAEKLGPGPGHYSPRTELLDEVSRGRSVTIKGKGHQREMYNTVGPGTYDVPTTIGKDARSVTIRGRLPNHELDPDRKHDVPGPGAYSPKW